MDNFLGFPIREPSETEKLFFNEHSDMNDLPNFIGGYAADDNAIVLNPFTELTPTMKRGVLMNEAARLFLRETGAEELPFDLTPEQLKMYEQFPVGEKTMKDMQHSLVGRILSGDPNLPKPTSEQLNYADDVFLQMMSRYKRGKRK